MKNYLSGFETDRLIIRKLCRRDILVWAEFFLDKASFDFIGLQDDRQPCDHSERWMERQFKRYREGEYGLMALIEKESMKLVGQCGLITMNVQREGELEIGYHILKEHRNMGFATEAALAFRDKVFENNITENLITVINTNNMLSVKVTNKLGFNKAGEIICMNKRSFLYRITRDEWLSLK